MAATTIQANAAGSTGDLSKWNEDPGDAIIAADDAPIDYFQIAGNHAARFPAGTKFLVTGSAANDGEYTVSASGFTAQTNIEVVEEVPAASAADGTIKIHRVPAATDVVDINGKRIVQGGAFTAVAEIKDIAADGTFIITKTFTPTLVTGVVIFQAPPPVNPYLLIP